MTTDFNAGLDSSDVQMAYAKEVAWSVTPAVAFKQLRVLSEGFVQDKTRTRPLEINPSGYAKHAITTQQSAKGAINFGLSFDTFHDFIAGALNSDWSTAASVDASLVIDATAKTVTGTGVDTNVTVGQWVNLFGFTNAGNNQPRLVTTVASGALTVEDLDNTLVSETHAAHLRGQTIRNSNSVTTYQIQKQLAAALFFLYSGCYVSSLQMTMQVGRFVEGVFNFLSKNGVGGTTDASTGAQVAAPAGRIIDNIGGFKHFSVNGAAPTSVLQSVDFTVTKERSASQYGIGSATAVGMRRGTVQVDGKLSLFFKDMTYYNDFLNEIDLRFAFQLVDHDGSGYMVTLPAASIMNPSIVAKGIDQDIVADFTLEGNPALATDTLFPNVTIQIDRLAGT